MNYKIIHLGIAKLPKMCFPNFRYANILNSLSLSNSHSLGVDGNRDDLEEANGGNTSRAHENAL